MAQVMPSASRRSSSPRAPGSGRGSRLRSSKSSPARRSTSSADSSSPVTSAASRRPSIPIIGSSRVARDDEAALGERRLPRVDARADRVDQRAVEVEDDRVGAVRVRHRSYDTEPMPSELAVHWTLDPAVTFLNHGSFGATPRAVLEAQDAWRARMEREPVAFFARDLEPALDDARERARAVPRCRSGRPRLRHERDHGRQHRRAQPAPRPRRRDRPARPRLPGCPQRAPGDGRCRRRPAGDRAPPRSGRHARGGARRRPRGRRPANAARDGGPRHEPDGARAAGGGDRGRARRPRDRHARRRRTRPGHGRRRPRRDRRRLHGRQLPQMDVRAEGQRVPPCPSGSPGAGAAARHQPRRVVDANRSKPVPARARLDRHARSHAVAERAGCHRVRRRPRSRWLARAARSRPPPGARGPRPPRRCARRAIVHSGRDGRRHGQRAAAAHHRAAPGGDG